MKKESNIMKTIVFIVVLFIPIIYSFFYLKSYWDPYGDLTGMQIAVVNLDKGEDGENQGKEFVQSLKDSATFSICEVNQDNANEGMQNGDYYATITIPSNFTEALNSASSKDKQIATITYSPNQATNYLATQIINSAVKTMEISLEEKIDSKIVETLADKLEEVPDSLQAISDGAEEILEGSKSLNSGLQQINDGTTTLNNSYTEFDNGVKSASEGSKTLDNGIKQVNSGVTDLNSGATSLDGAIAQINEGIKPLSQSNEEINTLVNQLPNLVAGANGLEQGVNSYVGLSTQLINQLLAQIDPQGTNTSLRAQAKQLEGVGAQITTGAQNVSAGVTMISNKAGGLKAITGGITNLQGALGEVKAGTESLKSGVATLSNGTKALQSGSSTLTTGLSTLSSSSSQVKTALNTLQEGTSTAYDGSTQLVEGVETFNNEVNKGINDTKEQLESLEGIEKIAEDPVEFKTEAYGEVNSYGIAFTPLFLSIGLWVGALMCYVVLYYDQKNRFGIFGSDSKNKLLQNALYIAIGAIEGIITGALLKLGLGYEIQNIVLYYFASALIGITFMSIIQCLIRNFGDVGKFLALIILVLQLAASGGTFPVETISKGFQGLTSYLPMTYSINLLREILVPTASNLKGQYIAILIGITLVTLMITYIVDIIKNKQED